MNEEALHFELIFYEDPGHAWMEVNSRWIIIFGIKDDISEYSYMNDLGTKAYLEEDSDAGVFIKALKENGHTYEIHSEYEDPSMIRRMNCYRAENINVRYQMIDVA